MKVCTGRVNAVSGGGWDRALHAEPQDYVVCPPQLWLDGINAGRGFVRQFVAVPLGRGYTVEAQVTGAESHGGLQFVVYEPKPGRFPDEPPSPGTLRDNVRMGLPRASAGGMGLGAGGKLTQKIYPDPFGIDVWDVDVVGATVVHLVNSEQYRVITGRPLPPTPVDAHTYSAHGLPWFELYDESFGDLAPPDALTRVRSTDAVACSEGSPLPADESIDIKPDQIKRLGGERD